jgi:hypothetical protein
MRIVGPALTDQADKKRRVLMTNQSIHVNTQQINTLCGQSVEFCGVKAGGTYRNQWALQANKNIMDINSEIFSKLSTNSSALSGQLDRPDLCKSVVHNCTAITQCSNVTLPINGAHYSGQH